MDPVQGVHELAAIACPPVLVELVDVLDLGVGHAADPGHVDHTGHCHQDRMDLVDEGVDQWAAFGGGGHRPFPARTLDRGHVAHRAAHRGGDQLAHQLRLGAEVVGDGLHRQARTFGDLSHGGGMVTRFEERVAGRPQYLPAGCLSLFTTSLLGHDTGHAKDCTRYTH